MNRRYPDLEFLITKEGAEKYFRSVGYKLPPEKELPLSYYSCLREGEFKVFRDLQVELKQLLHVSQLYTYFTHVCIGDVITSKVKIAKINSRKLGGELVVFIELHNQYFKRGELAADVSGSVIVRELQG